ncbi:carboxypeptidase M32 [Fusobacterium sp.]|uniref:carboxypeptidase M32 n=1 Tax=Fusobacterium sp. TaxID=68766 RepID=UPI0028FF7111|nr:carboxypeptidase M32 [Fusobacterium sp.]MDU1909687.1 carboxypeptidase M32 [Fusobacterium sp.]
MKKEIKRFRELIKEKKLIDSSLGILQWDLETTTPRKGKELLSEMVGYLSMKGYNIVTSEEFLSLVNFLKENEKDLDDIQRKEIDNMAEEIEKISKIPPHEYQEYSELTAKTQGIWEEAKAKNDFKMFKENLKKIFEFNIKFAEYQGKKDKKIYDIILDEYEKGMTTEKLNEFFSGLRAEIVPLLKKIMEKKKINEKSYINEKVTISEQKKFNRFLSEYLGFDFDRGVVAESEHPFTLNLDKNDVRLTTKYTEDIPFSSIFSTIHETGHGIYEQQIGDDLLGTTLATGGSMGLHESQSRFYENMIGRSISFWKGIYDKNIDIFPFLKKIKIEELYRDINKVEPSFIRTEADELTYSLHIMIRYEIEKGIVNREIGIDDLPEVWNKKMEEYLGIVPETDREGILQDVHWACGLIGYFPSYALGNVYAAQLYNTMKKDMAVDLLLENGKLDRIKGWLRDKIHIYGKLRETGELIQEVTGEELEPKYYIEYLKEKYSKIYNLD